MKDAEINKRHAESYTTLLVSGVKSTWNYLAEDVRVLSSCSGRFTVWFSPRMKVRTV